MKKFYIFVVAALMVAVMAVPISAQTAFAANKDATQAAEQTVFLKGTGSNFSKNGWNNVFYTGGAERASNPSVWHIVYSGKVMAAITAMQITFTNGTTFQWEPEMDFSRNGGGNNPGWVIAAPAGWEIAYVNKGNNNASGSFVKTTEAGNAQFNISGFYKGTPDKNEPTEPEEPVEIASSISVNLIFQGSLQGNGFGWWGFVYGIYDITLTSGKALDFDWDAVYNAYANASNLYSEWNFGEESVLEWRSSGQPSFFFEGARPDFFFTEIQREVITTHSNNGSITITVRPLLG